MIGSRHLSVVRSTAKAANTHPDPVPQGESTGTCGYCPGVAGQPGTHPTNATAHACACATATGFIPTSARRIPKKMRPALILLLAGAQGLAPATKRPRVVVSPCGGSVGLCLLRSLKVKDCDVVAICRDEVDEARVRQNTCGCSMRQGEVTDMCGTAYPALETVICETPRELRRACEGASAVVALPAGDAHPRLAPSINDGTIVRPTVAATKKSADHARRLVAASDETAHVVLLSALGAGAEPDRPPLASFLAARTGCLETLAEKRALETDVSASGRRFTILRAPPLASGPELEAIDKDSDGDPNPALSLITPSALAHAALHAALDTSGTYRGTYEAKSTRPRRPKTPAAAASSPSSGKS